MGTLKTNEEIKKEISEAMEELSWVVEGGDAHDLQDACDKAHACLADTLALIERLESDASFYKNISALMDKTNKEALSLIDSLIESNLKRAEKIEQLKAQNAELSENIMWMEAERDDLKRTIQQLEAKAGLVEQYRWERDVAIDQLKQLGIGFGEKVDGKGSTELLKKVEQLQAEREMIRQAFCNYVPSEYRCDCCRYSYLNNPGADCCPYYVTGQCDGFSMWEYYGVKKEESNDQ